MRLVKSGDSVKIKNLIARLFWVNKEYACHKCGCRFVLTLEDREKIHFEVNGIKGEMDELYYGYYVACPECQSDVVVYEDVLKYVQGHKGIYGISLGMKQEAAEKDREKNLKLKTLELRKKTRKYLPIFRELEKKYRTRSLGTEKKRFSLRPGKDIDATLTLTKSDKYYTATLSFKDDKLNIVGKIDARLCGGEDRLTIEWGKSFESQLCGLRELESADCVERFSFHYQE